MSRLLYCIRYPVKPFLACPSRFLLPWPTRGARHLPQPTCAAKNVAFPRTHAFSRAAITGRIRARSEKLDSRDRLPSSIRQERPRPAQLCTRVNRHVISSRSHRLLGMLVGRGAKHARQAAISEQAAHRRLRHILHRRTRSPNRNRPHAPRPLSRSHSASPRRPRPRLQ